MSHAATDLTRVKPPAATSHSRRRADIQGLRAIAVVLVVLNHVFLWPSGGFLGVDVFYVISGFLITGLLLREVEQSGSISFRGFYARRIRRILPAAVIVLVVTVMVAALLWFPLRSLQTVIDAFWSLVFMSNWHFEAAGSDYFATDARSPLLHYWSLAVEEQFYAVWPLVILAVVLVAHRIGVKRLRIAIGVTVALLTLASLAWAGWRAGSGLDGGYFDSVARAWELLAGAAIAVIGTSRLRERARRAISLAGLALVAVSALLIHETWGVPFPWVIPAVLGVALVIWADAPASPRGILGNPISQWLGDVSYSLYLWHFPVIVFATSVLGNSVWVQLGSLAAMLALAACSFRWIEQPFQRGPLLRRASKLRNARPIVPRDLAVGAVAVVAVALLTVVTVRGPGGLHDSSSIANRFPGDSRQVAAETVAQREADLTHAVTNDVWPDSLSNPSAWRQSLAVDGGDCMNDVSRAPGVWCGDPAEADVIVVGDSVAMSWLSAVRAALTDDGADVAGIGFAGCQLAMGLEYSHPAFGSEFPRTCATVQRELIAEIAAHEPDTLVLIGHPAALQRLDLPLSEASVKWQAAYETMLREFSGISRVVVLESNPWDRDFPECLVRTDSPDGCITQLDEWHLAKADAERAATQTASNSVYVQTRDWFCADRGCPSVVDDTVVTTDGLHLSAPGSATVDHLLDEALARAGVGNPAVP
ncbi:hypothetical protein ASD19_06950 [Microbacterium sp. Root53]|uniref:acyltransferase family protein n=1 Tax=Microbacterium sp. Root53 TaxID=1736553 RepID=UPI0006F2DA37|nr:acyltransferase family protein [Microbacterium sp. Root53]KQY98569.1 hypothetical protein ASD19_06950 [Microbacterium sp. Root53]